MKRAAAVALLPVLAGCTFDDGRGYATLKGASLSVVFEPGPARDLGNDTVLTDRGYAVRVTNLTLELDDLELLQLSTSGGGLGQSFDPENPPPGYGPCHGGHCHTEDGRLVPYADIEAELAGGVQASFTPVVTLGSAGSYAALDDPSLALGISPSGELPRVELAKASLPIRFVILKAVVRRAKDDGSSALLDASLSPGPTLQHGLSIAIDRDGPERLALSARMVIDGAVFDGIDFDAALTAGSTTWTSIDEPNGGRLLQNLSNTHFDVKIR